MINSYIKSRKSIFILECHLEIRAQRPFLIQCDPGIGPFSVLAYSSHVCVGSLQVLWLPPSVQKHASSGVSES